MFHVSIWKITRTNLFDSPRVIRLIGQMNQIECINSIIYSPIILEENIMNVEIMKINIFCMVIKLKMRRITTIESSIPNNLIA